MFLAYVEVTYHQKFESPLTGIKAVADSAIIARGKYLVLGPSHCYACHTNDSLRALKLKEPLIGGNIYKTPFGDFHMPNITMDMETGIGKLTDEEIARSIRYNVNHRSEAMASFMSYNNFSDADLQAIVSYLRTTEPVRHRVPPHDFNMLGKIISRFVLEPKYDIEVETLSPDTTAAYGKYIAFTVGQCNSCHTRRDKLGRFDGDPLAGGAVWEYEDGTYTSPNLTPDKATGHIVRWTQDGFMQRFKAGRVLPKSPMPWEAYQDMTDTDLKALYNYLMSLSPVSSATTPTYVSNKDSSY